jgi:hypothetical protein
MKNRRTGSVMFWLSLAAVAITACGSLAGRATPTAVPTLPPAKVTSLAASETPAPPATTLPTAVPPTAAPPTAVPPTQIPPTEVPPTAVPPSATVRPTATSAPTAAPARLYFPVGGTDMDVAGQLKANEMRIYVLGAAKGQPMIVSVSSPDSAVRLAIRGADGTPLLDVGAARADWQGLLPATQDYLLYLIGPAAATDFDLSIEIASRITFEKGAVSATVKGVSTAGPITTYVLRAMSGQTMTATLKSEGNAVVLSIYGFDDGSPLVRSAADATTFTTQLPATQDYIVKAVQTGGTPVDFILTVIVK